MDTIDSPANWVINERYRAEIARHMVDYCACNLKRPSKAALWNFRVLFAHGRWYNWAAPKRCNGATLRCDIVAHEGSARITLCSTPINNQPVCIYTSVVQLLLRIFTTVHTSRRRDILETNTTDREKILKIVPLRILIFYFGGVRITILFTNSF